MFGFALFYWNLKELPYKDFPSVVPLDIESSSPRELNVSLDSRVAKIARPLFGLLPRYSDFFFFLSDFSLPL